MPLKSDKAHYISLMIILEIALWLREGWYVRSAVCDHVSGERAVGESISDTHKHTLRHIYPQRWAYTWKLAKIQKMAEIYTMWDAPHYDRCTQSHTQSCAKARAYTHAQSWDLCCGWCGHDNKDTLFSCFQCKGYRQIKYRSVVMMQTEVTKRKVRDYNTLAWDVPETHAPILYVWIT